MGAWIEIQLWGQAGFSAEESHPTMGAWIEIVVLAVSLVEYGVAPHDGCVD